MFSHNAVLCGTLEVLGAASGACSRTSSGSGPGPPLESEITGFALPPVDHARSSSSCLVPIGGAAPVALSCRLLRRDSDQAFGPCTKHLAVAAAGRVYSHGGESNNVWCLVAVPSFFFFPTAEVAEAAGGAHSHAPSDGRPCLPLASKTTAIVCPCCL